MTGIPRDNIRLNMAKIGILALIDEATGYQKVRKKTELREKLEELKRENPHNKVYIVTSGEYSDYQIQAVFSTEEKAQEWIGNNKDEEIEEYELDKADERYHYIEVGMRKDGTLALAPEVHWGQKLRPSYHTELSPRRGELLFWYVQTQDMERAVKVINEKRVQILAANAWGDWEYLTQLKD